MAFGFEGAALSKRLTALADGSALSLRSAHQRMATIAHGVLVAALAWGAFSFGAVYPWAYWPLALAAQAVGFAGLFVERRLTAGASRALILALLLFACAALLQLLPLPNAVLRSLSPETPGIIAQLEPAVAAGLAVRHPISIQPTLTWTGIGLFGSFALLLVGVSRLLSFRGAAATVNAITVLGVCLALTGIIQNAVYAGKIYGFWIPQMGGNPFGPFVNKNHFAGWMLLALPLTLGLACARIARGMRGVVPNWRDRLLWLSSAEANQLVLLLGAAAVMALSLVMAMSRSGIGSLALALLLTGWFVMRGRSTPIRKAVATASLVALSSGVVLWVGLDTILERFSVQEGRAFNDRWGPWGDAWNIVKAFPLMGTGLNTYGIAMLFYQRHDPQNHYAQAHNDYLQLAAEGGLLLVVPAVICLLLLVRDIRRRLRDDYGLSSYWIRAGAVAAMIAMALQETVEFSLQMPGNAALFAVVCGIALHKSAQFRGTGQPAADTLLQKAGIQVATMSRSHREHRAERRSRVLAAADEADRLASGPGAEQPCPECHSYAFRSKARSIFQRIRKRLTDKRIFRCSACGWRGWLIPMDITGLAAPVGTVLAPNLEALDTLNRPGPGKWH